MRRRSPCSLLGHAILAMTMSAAASDFDFSASSYLGEAGFNDAITGGAIQSDGIIALAGNLGPAVRKKLGAVGSGQGCVVRLTPDGARVLSAVSVAGEINDLAIDAADNLYLAAGTGGLIKTSPDGSEVVWTVTPGSVTRVDAGTDGHTACIVERSIHIFDADGKALGTAAGGQYTCDVCVDSDSKTVIQTGFRNARAFDGKKTYPVQICYVHGHAYDGQRTWTNYDWSTDRESDRFLNKPTNNMADSRGDRCAIGRDGKLYVTFQVAGGNHIFRYHPRDIMRKVELAGGDNYHKFHNSRAEHKCFFARFEPATGDFLAGQQFCGRLSSGRANYVATKDGDITADAEGCVYVVGRSAAGLPLSLNPTGGDYSGGGFLLVMSSDLTQRLLCTRTCDGRGAPHAVDVRTIDGRKRVVYAGSGMTDGMFVREAIQGEPGDTGGGKNDPKDGFFAVVEDR